MSNMHLLKLYIEHKNIDLQPIQNDLGMLSFCGGMAECQKCKILVKCVGWDNMNVPFVSTEEVRIFKEQYPEYFL